MASKVLYKGSPFESFVSHKEGAPRNSYSIEKEEGGCYGEAEGRQLRKGQAEREQL